MKLYETLFVGRDNAIRLTLSEDTSLLSDAYPDLVPTRWLLTIGTNPPTEFDSSLQSGLFSWDHETSVLQMSFGPSLSPSLAALKASTTLRMWSAEFPNGVVLLHPTCTPDKLFITICNEG